MSQYSKSRDGNERAICQALEAIPGRDVTVQPIEGGRAYEGSALPNAGPPDLLVGMAGVTWLMEVKNPSTRSVAGQHRIKKELAELGARYWPLTARLGWPVVRKLRKNQAEWMMGWGGSPVHVVTTAQEAAAVLGVCLTCGADAVSTTGLCADCQADAAGVS